MYLKDLVYIFVFVCSDCSEVYADGNVASGLYVIRPDSSPTTLSVYCDMHNGGGWTVFQRRRDGKESFDRCASFTLIKIEMYSLHVSRLLTCIMCAQSMGGVQAWIWRPLLPRWRILAGQ